MRLKGEVRANVLLELFLFGGGLGASVRQGVSTILGDGFQGFFWNFYFEVFGEIIYCNYLTI